MAGNGICPHAHAKPEVCDQTLGVGCPECQRMLAVCWAEEHISESLWNLACKNDSEGIPCEQNRDDVCALCGANFGRLAFNPMGPSPDFYCLACDEFDIVPHDHETAPEPSQAKPASWWRRAIDFVRGLV